MPQVGGTGLQPGDIAGQNKKKRQEIEQTYQQQQPQSVQNVATVEKHSNGILPTQVNWALANLDSQEKDLIRTTHIVANAAEVKPLHIYGINDAQEHHDPTFANGALGFGTLQRVTNNFANPAVASMMSRVAPNQDPRVTSRIAQFARVLAPGLAQYNLTYNEGLFLAMQLASQKGVTVKAFAQNLKVLTTWGQNFDIVGHTTRVQGGRSGVTPTTPGWAVAVSMASHAAAQGQTWNSALDIVNQVLPKEVTDYAAQEAAQSADINAQPVNPLDTPGRRGMVSDFLTSGPDSATAAIQALASNGYADGSNNLWVEANKLSDQVIMDKTSFQRSWFNRNILSPVGHVVQDAYVGIEKGVTDIAVPFVLAKNLAVAASGHSVDYQSEHVKAGDIRSAVSATNTWYSHEFDLYNKGVTIGTQLATAIHVPKIMGNGFDLVVQWSLDPTVLFGKVTQGFNEARYIGDISQTTYEAAKTAGKANTFDDMVTQAQAMAKSPMSRRVFDTIYNDGNYFAQNERWRTTLDSSSALDPTYLGITKDELLKAFPEKSAEAWQAWQDTVLAHFAGFGPEDSVARQVWQRYLHGQSDAEAAADAARVDPMGVRMNGPSAPISPDEGVQNAVTGMDLNADGFHPPLRAEVARYWGPGVEWGPIRAIRAGYAKLSEADPGAGGSAFFTRDPGRFMNTEAGADTYGYLHFRRWGMPESDARAIQQEMAGVARTVGKNSRFEDIMLTHSRQAFEDYFHQGYAGPIDEQTINDAFDHVYGPSMGRNNATQIFGQVPAVDEETGVSYLYGATSPMQTSQLSNVLSFPDPVAVQRYIDRYIGLPRAFQSHLLDALGKEIPELDPVFYNHILTNVARRSGDTLRWLQDARVRAWKTLTVARPAYILRVGFGDQGLKSLVSAGSFADRVGASRLIDRVAGDLFDMKIEGLPDPVTGDTKVIMGPGDKSWMPEPLAASFPDRAGFDSSVVRQARKLGQQFRADGSFDDYLPTHTGHIERWNEVLTRVRTNSLEGRIALQSVADGDSVQATAEKLFAYGKSDRATMGAINVVGDNAIKVWADEFAGIIHNETMGSREIANAALFKSDKLPDILAKQEMYVRDAKGEVVKEYGQPVFNRPTIYGPAMEPLRLRNSASDFADSLYKKFVQGPEDVINRQPFYSLWNTRAQRSYYTLVRDSGAEITPAVDQAIKVAARNFALGQVKDTLLELSRSSRFSDALKLVFPFPQPFIQGIEKWAMLAVEHPEIIGRARALWNFGISTGFIQQNADGEYVVPWQVWHGLAQSATARALIGGFSGNDASTGGWAPVRGFSMLTQSLITLPSEGIVGRVVGGTPIPFPGFDPAAALVLQRMFAGSTNPSVVSTLFQFGPKGAASLLPTILQKAIASTGTGDGKIDDNARASVVDNILQTWQATGLTTNPDGSPIPEKELVARAEAEATNILHENILMSWINPAAIIRKYGSSALENEFAAMLKSNNGDYGKAAAEFNAKYSYTYTFPGTRNEGPGGRVQRQGPQGKTVQIPLYPLITGAKTIYGAVFTDPSTGDTVTPPRPGTSEYLAKLIAEPGMQGVLHDHPEFLALFAIGINPNAQTFDYPTFARLVSQHILNYKTPAQYFESGEAQQFWTEYNAWKAQVWNPQYDKLTALHVGTSSTAYQGLEASRRQFFMDLYQQFPDVALKVFGNVHRDDKGNITSIDWAGGSPPSIDSYVDSKGVSILAAARQVADLPGAQDFPGIKALNVYFNGTDPGQAGQPGLTGRDALNRQMVAKGLTDISSDPALQAKYDKLKSGIEALYPGTSSFIDAVFSKDLQGLSPVGHGAWDKLAPEMRDQLEIFSGGISNLSYKARAMSSDNLDKYKTYLDQQHYINTEYAKNPDVVAAYIKTLYGTPAQLDAQRSYLSAIAPVYYSRLDWQIMGVKMTNKAAAAWEQVAKMENDITAHKLQDPNWASTDAWNAIDKFAKDVKDQSFQNTRQLSKSWSWGFEQAGLTHLPGEVGRIWSNVLDLSKNAQKIVDSALAHGQDIHGVSTGTAYNKGYYNFLKQKYVLHYIDIYKQQSPAFAKSYDSIQNTAGSTLLDLLMPDSYYPLGGT